MKLQESEYTFYTYLRTKTSENWKTCFDVIVSQMKRKKFTLDDDSKRFKEENNCDVYNDGSLGAPLLFVKKVKRP